MNMQDLYPFVYSVIYQYVKLHGKYCPDPRTVHINNYFILITVEIHLYCFVVVCYLRFKHTVLGTHPAVWLSVRAVRWLGGGGGFVCLLA